MAWQRGVTGRGCDGWALRAGVMPNKLMVSVYSLFSVTTFNLQWVSTHMTNTGQGRCWQSMAVDLGKEVVLRRRKEQRFEHLMY